LSGMKRASSVPRSKALIVVVPKIPAI